MDKEEIKKTLEYRSLKEEEFEQLANVINKAFNLKRTAEDYKNRILGDKIHRCARQFIAAHDKTLVSAVRADYKPLFFNASPDAPFKKYECGEINDVATLKQYRQMGIARKLLVNAIDYMMDQGWDVAVLQTDPRYHARILYESEGFKVLNSTWDIWHVAFGKFKAIWKRYPFLALFFPFMKVLTKIIAPQPPKSCRNLIKNENPSKHLKQEVDKMKLRFIRVIGDINLDHAWVKSWLEGINEQKKHVQGIYESYIDSVLLKKDLNAKIHDNMLEKFKKNKQLREFIKEGGTKFNFMLVQHDGEAKDKRVVERINSSDINGDGIIGGLRYKVDDLSYGPLKVVVPMLDTIFIHEKYQDQGLGTLLLNVFRDDISEYFPFALCKAGSGNVPLRKALKKSKFHDIIGVITMVRVLNNKALYEKLDGSIEPWLLA
ncbi:MAG: GNAT family N-acetyltransferase [Candidatus Hodarchaeota archaeon]